MIEFSDRRHMLRVVEGESMCVAAPCDISSFCRAIRLHSSLIPFDETAAQPLPHFQFALSRGPLVLVQYIAFSISYEGSALFSFGLRTCVIPNTFLVACRDFRGQARRRDVTGDSKGKGHPRRGHEGPEGEQMYSSTLPSTSALDGGG